MSLSIDIAPDLQVRLNKEAARSGWTQAPILRGCWRSSLVEIADQWRVC